MMACIARYEISFPLKPESSFAHRAALEIQAKAQTGQPRLETSCVRSLARLAAAFPAFPVMSGGCAFHVYLLREERAGTGTLNAGKICRK
jgi:hypothetical protein